MKKILQAVHAVDGVRGTLVLEGNGQILAYQSHAVYDLELLEKVSQTVVSAVDSVQLLHSDWDTLSASFTDGTVIVRNIKPGGAAAGRVVVLALIADSNVNHSFAGVALRVAAAKVKAVIENPGSSADLSSSTIGSGGMNSPSAISNTLPGIGGGAQAATARKANASSIRTDLGSSGLSWSGLGSSGRVTSDVAVADPESSAFLTAATKALGASVGPMSKVFVKEAVRQLCPDRPFARQNWEALISELRKHINDTDDAAEFLKTLRARL
jgi:hypothetical protein